MNSGHFLEVQVSGERGWKKEKMRSWQLKKSCMKLVVDEMLGSRNWLFSQVPVNSPPWSTHLRIWVMSFLRSTINISAKRDRRVRINEFVNNQLTGSRNLP